MDRGDYSILARFAERRYNQFGGGAPVMTVMVDGASGATEKRREQIAREAKTSILSDMMNFPSFFIPGFQKVPTSATNFAHPSKPLCQPCSLAANSTTTRSHSRRRGEKDL
jgi:hypothetical protein